MRIETLALSERRGCALGATTALIADWAAVRGVLDRAAARTGIDVPACILPGEAAVAAVIQAGVDGPAAERALAFGGEQLLLQNRGLFDLLEARAEAARRACKAGAARHRALAMRFEGTPDYVATDDLKVAVNAAVTLRRPLLVKGEPGTGKTVLAEEIAAALGAPADQLAHQNPPPGPPGPLRI